MNILFTISKASFFFFHILKYTQFHDVIKVQIYLMECIYHSVVFFDICLIDNLFSFYVTCIVSRLYNSLFPMIFHMFYNF